MFYALITNSGCVHQPRGNISWIQRLNEMTIPGSDAGFPMCSFEIWYTLRVMIRNIPARFARYSTRTLDRKAV